MISPYSFFKHEVKAFKHGAYELEFDPKVQWNFHRKMTWFWALSIIPTVPLMILDIADSSLLLTAIILIWNTLCSWYANFATELDAVSASYAAIKSDEAANNTGDEK